jgi:hypothetical protein
MGGNPEPLMNGSWGGAGLRRGPEPEVGEDPPNDRRILHGGDEMHPAPTTGTGQHIDLKRPPHQRRPHPIAGTARRRSWSDGLGDWGIEGVRPLVQLLGRPSLIGDHLAAPFGVRGQDPVIEHQVDLGPRG